MGKEKIKKIKRVPTERMKRTLDNFVANRGKSMKQSMLSAGFSKAYSKNSGQLLKSATWQELTENVLADVKLVAVHEELLKNKDWRARDAGLDKAYKVRGKYAPEQIELTKRKYQDLSNKELAELEQTLIKFLTKK